MKPNRTTLFIFISSFALLAVLSIQVRWMLQSAKEKEELFHEKANIVLARTTEMLSADKNIAGKLEHGDWRSESPKIDSLLQHYMNYYNFHSDYTFEVVPALPLKSIQAISDPVYSKNTLQACYDKSLDEMKRMNKWELRLHFPNHNGFIKAEMGIPFIGSVVLIVIVLLLFGRTVQSLAAGKKYPSTLPTF